MLLSEIYSETETMSAITLKNTSQVPDVRLDFLQDLGVSAGL